LFLYVGREKKSLRCCFEISIYYLNVIRFSNVNIDHDKIVQEMEN